MAPEILTQQEAEELKELAGRIRAWQEARQISDNEMLRKFAGLGSTKTYTRILRGDMAELDLERQAINYRQVWALIEAMRTRDAGDDEAMPDLHAAQQLRRAFLEVIEETSNARLILVEGDTGMGKTKALECLLAKYGQRVLPIQAWHAWNDNPGALLDAILLALGVKNIPASIVGRIGEVTRHLCSRRCTVMIDEGHHLGPCQLNTIKGFINTTPGEWIILAMPSLWGRIERDAWQEVRQLTGNRLAERIKLDGLQVGDVRKLLERRARVTDARAVNHVMGEAKNVGARNRGNLKFVAKVCKALAEKFPDGAVPELADVVAACAAEAAKR